MPDTPKQLALTAEFLVHPGDDGAARVQVRLAENTAWLTQRQTAYLYQVTVPTVSEHLAHIYDEGKLDPAATVRRLRIVQPERKRLVSRLVERES